MLRNPILIFTLILTIYMIWYEHTGNAPVLDRVSATTSYPLLLLGGGGLLVACECAMRMWRTENSEAIDVSPASEGVRTAALLMAASTPVVLGVIVQAATLVTQLLDRPVTELVPAELVTGPVAVAIMVAAGVAAGRWFPSRFTGPMVLVGGLVLSTVLSMYDLRRLVGEVLPWFGLYVPIDVYVPYQVMFRPAGSHLLYLFGILAVLAAVTILKGSTGKLAVSIGALVGVVLIGVGGMGQIREYRAYDEGARLAALLPPDAEYVCETEGVVEYCVLPGYQPWVGEWDALIQPVLDLVPTTVEAFTVRQYPTGLFDSLLLYGSRRDLAGNDLTTGVFWGRGAGTGQVGGDGHPFGMALGAAAWVTGFPRAGTEGGWVDLVDENGNYAGSEWTTDLDLVEPDQRSANECSAGNQGRAVVALWMAARASDVTEQHLRNLVEKPPYPLFEEFTDADGNPYTTFHGISDQMSVGQQYPWWPVVYFMSEAYYAYQLLELPEDQVRAVVAANWEMLTDPTTSTVTAVEVLGLDVVPGLEEASEDRFRFTRYSPCG